MLASFLHMTVLRHDSLERVLAFHLSSKLAIRPQEGGIGALEHPQSKTMTDHRKNPFIADKPDHEKTQAELIEELCYMRAKVAYL